MQPEIQKDEYQKYYVPAQSPWPIVGAVALFLIAVGAGNYVVEATKGETGYGGHILLAGVAVLLVMLISVNTILMEQRNGTTFLDHLIMIFH